MYLVCNVNRERAQMLQEREETMTSPPDAPQPDPAWHDAYQEAERAIAGYDIAQHTSWWTAVFKALALLAVFGGGAYAWFAS